MLIPITYIDSKYSETGEAKLNESLSDDFELTAEEKEKREEKLRQREIDRIIGKVDEEEEFLHEEPKIEFRTIKFQDDDGNTIVVNREFLDEQKMSFEEIVSDWLSNADEDDLQQIIHTV